MSSGTVSVAPYVLSTRAATVRRLQVLRDINASPLRRALLQADKKGRGASWRPHRLQTYCTCTFAPAVRQATMASIPTP